MSKKRKGNKPTSARGHVEGNVIRWREKVDLIRVDRKGRPINRPIPVNTFDRNWLAQNLIDTRGNILSSPPKPPDNVSKMSDHRPKPKPVATSGNEAESVQEPPTSGKRVDYAFLHNKSIAVDEFRHWSRLSKEIGRSSPIVWANNNGKLSSPDLELQRQRSKDGHSKPKLKFESPPSTVRNPMISATPIVVHNKRLRAASSKGVSPSGEPISLFTEGKFKPINNKNPVVYTKQWPFVEEVKQAPPPTATRDWRGTPAANDGNTQHLHRTPTVKSIEHQLNSEVQWFINHVEPQNWPVHVHNFAHWKSGGPTPNTGAINKAAAEWGERYKLMKSMYHGLLEDWKMLDSALSMSHQEINLLNQELKAEKQERMSLEWQLAAATGDHVSADEIAREMQNNIIKPKTPDVPDDVDVMLAQFNVYQSFVKCDGPEHAFARYVYNDPKLGDVIRDHADMLCQQRQDAVVGRTYARNLSKFMYALGKYKEAEYAKFWRDAMLTNAKRRNRAKYTAVRSVPAEATAYAAMARKAKPALYKQDSTYYRAFSAISGSVNTVLHSSDTCSIVQSVGVYEGLSFRDREVNSAIAKGILSKVKPIKHRQCPVKAAKYEKWWSQWLDYAEMKYHESTASGRAKIAIVKGYNKLIDTFNTPVDPPTRKRQRDKLAQLRAQQHILDEQREQRKERKVKRKEQQAYKRKLKQAYGVAH